ncbi:pyrimidine dimer DNA glycosylase/endonuclease V [Tessaracoccus sp. OS52]|uniref:pyrimidine dimer DNA glycosylase/endonuclease V n=1 Tax=Tessaracoccus sp. OS52 TaxID=2886691 RepID=UPI001D0FE149|nr:pyrimidine dimer DNA glycosylase/endonuclease V [Tessaracoccus sp. OS52]MCC2594361.1 pyrimidine dimer DNA glycosylase/endonuclease V [Tessaracoccus sp. OS52]
MRLWSLNPSLLDRAALVACWREGLLAQAVLAGRTKGYRNHPQLERFRSAPDPLVATATYLTAVAAEAAVRGYRFDLTRLLAIPDPELLLTVTTGQLAFELEHLRTKVRARAPQWEPQLTAPLPHPMFEPVDGDVEPWERQQAIGEPAAG